MASVSLSHEILDMYFLMECPCPLTETVCNFKYNIRSQSGCPSSGVLFQIKKNAKKWFKYEVYGLRKQQAKVGEALTQARQTDFWNAVPSL